MDQDVNYWLRTGARRLGRRRLLASAGATGLGLVGLSLAGCGGNSRKSASNAAAPASAGAGSSTAAGNATPATRATSGATASAAVSAPAASGVQPKRGGTLNINGVNWSKLEAVTGTGGNDHWFLWTVFDNLVGYGPDFSPDPNRSLASSWENPDPLTWIFHLRQGVKFHDGTDFNADAVRQNFAYATDPSVPSNVRSDLKPVDHMDATDATTAVYHLSVPVPGFIASLGDRPGFMSSPAAITKWGNDYGLHPVGTGAFVYDEYVQDNHTKVHRNPNYWAKDAAGTQLPYLDGIMWRNVDQPGAQVAALRTGELDMLLGVPGQFIKELQTDAKMQLVSKPGAGCSFFYMNRIRPPFNNVDLRRAIAFAFAREPIINNVYFGAAVPAIGNIGPAHWAFDPNVKRQTLNAQLVRDALQRAGVPNGFGFQMSIWSSPAGQQEGELLQASAKQFGIDIKLQALAAPDYYLKYINDGFADAMNAGFTARADPAQYFKFNYHSQGTYRKTVDDSLDAEIDALSQIADRNQQKAAISRFQQKVNDDAYSAYIRHDNVVVAAAKKVHFSVFADGKEHLGNGDVWIES